MNFSLSWPVIFIGGACILVFIVITFIRWMRTRSEEETTSGFREGDKFTVWVVGFLGVSTLPFAPKLYLAVGLVLLSYCLYFVIRFIHEEKLEDREVTRPLTPQEQRIADDVLLYARKNKKVPLPKPPERPTRQVMGRLTNEELRTCDRTVWPYNRLDWSLIDGPNTPVQGNS